MSDNHHNWTIDAAEQTRRGFLATAAAATGAAAVLGPRFASAAPFVAPRGIDPVPPGPDEAIRMGVIGTGGMGTGHCEAFVSFGHPSKDKEGNVTAPPRENVQVVALADVCDPRLMAAKAKCEKGQEGMTVDTFRNYKELLARKDVHAVLIASPEHWHAQMAIDAILAGKDVYLEKPMTLNLEDAMRLRETMQKNPKVIVQVGTQKMQIPKFHAAKKLIAEGAIGTPTFSQTSYCRNSKEGEWLYYAIDKAWEPGKNLDWDNWCGPAGKAPWDPQVYARWRRYKKYSTGIIGDLLVHEMTPLLLALDAGWPTRVVATGAHMVDKAMENFDQVNLTIQFENGHTMVVAGSTCNEVGFEVMIRGHKANIYLGGKNCVMRPERIFAEEVDAQTVECPDIENDQDLHRLAWLKAIRTREQPASSVDLGTKIMVIVDLASRSMWEGHAYTFDPKTLKATKV